MSTTLRSIVICLVVGLVSPCVNVKAIEWELGPTGSKASFRAISTPSSQVVWISGSQGTVLRSLDGGDSWQNVSPRENAEMDFRSLHAWDEQRACIASAGSPAIILLTEDGGEHWTLPYHNAAPEAFFDCLKFWDDDHGLAISDPISGTWLIVETHDGGNTWNPIAVPLMAEPKEAAFAASNSSLLVGTQGAAWFGTGGVEASNSLIHRRLSASEKWTTHACPIPSNASSGVFAIAQHNGILVAVGGDYRPTAVSPQTAAWSDDDGETWQVAEQKPAAFRSAVVAVPTQASQVNSGQMLAFVATGPAGSDWSLDGRNWQQFSTNGFHALACTATDIFAVGSEGRFARLKLETVR